MDGGRSVLRFVFSSHNYIRLIIKTNLKNKFCCNVRECRVSQIYKQFENCNFGPNNFEIFFQ